MVKPSTWNDLNVRESSQDSPSERRRQRRRRDREDRARRRGRQGRHGAPAHPLRPQGRHPADRRRASRSSSSARSSASPASRSPPATGCMSTIATWAPSTAPSSATISSRGRACREHPAGRGTGDLPGLSPRQRQGRHAQLCRHPDLGELLDHGRRLHRQGDRALRHPRRLSQHRRHRRAEAGQWLRHRLSRRDLRHAEEDHLGLCHQPEHGRRGHGRPRLRGFPDSALQGGLRRPGERDVPHHDDPGGRRHEEDRRGRRRGGEGHAADRQQGEARDAAGIGTDAGAAVRRLGRLFGHHRQPGARRRGGHPRPEWRHGDPFRDARRSTAPSTC